MAANKRKTDPPARSKETEKGEYLQTFYAKNIVNAMVKYARDHGIKVQDFCRLAAAKMLRDVGYIHESSSKNKF